MLRSDLIGPATCNRCVQRDPGKGTARTPNRCPQHHRSTGASGADAFWAAWSLGIQQTSFVRTTLRRRPLHMRDDSLPAGTDMSSWFFRAFRLLYITIHRSYTLMLCHLYHTYKFY